MTAQMTFSDFGVHPKILENLTRLQFINPTPIQAKAIPPALEMKDVIGCAQTGTGKTAAFGIPLVSRLVNATNETALVLAPTRELAIQIHKVIEQISQGSRIRGVLLIGGESFHNQKRQIRSGFEFIIATPGRLVDHLQQGTIHFHNTKLFVLDEFDRMLDMGFAPQLNEIRKSLPREKQTLLFSATFPNDLAKKVSEFVKNPVKVVVGDTGQKAAAVTEKIILMQQGEKGPHLLRELAELNGRTLVFARTQQRVERVTAQLQKRGYTVAQLHGGRPMRQRVSAVTAFKTGKANIMVATDIAGRGLDVDDICTVINYDLPSTREDYVHRIGRTARYGKSGRAINFVTSDERKDAKRLMGT